MLFCEDLKLAKKQEYYLARARQVILIADTIRSYSLLFDRVDIIPHQLCDHIVWALFLLAGLAAQFHIVIN